MSYDLEFFTFFIIFFGLLWTEIYNKLTSNIVIYHYSQSSIHYRFYAQSAANLHMHDFTSAMLFLIV